MTALSVPMHGEYVPPRRWVAIASGLCGALLVLRPTGRSAVPVAALAAAALGAVSYALSALTVRTLGRTNSSTSMVFWVLVISGAGCGILALGDWRPIPSHDWGWLALVGICGALGQYWLTEAFRSAPPAVVGPFEYTAILWAFAIDWLFWQAAPTPPTAGRRGDRHHERARRHLGRTPARAHADRALEPPTMNGGAPIFMQ